MSVYGGTCGGRKQGIFPSRRGHWAQDRAYPLEELQCPTLPLALRPIVPSELSTQDWPTRLCSPTSFAPAPCSGAGKGAVRFECPGHAPGSPAGRVVLSTVALNKRGAHVMHEALTCDKRSVSFTAGACRMAR